MAEFDAFVALIREQGERKPWPRPSPEGRWCRICGREHGWAKTHNHYLELDGWQYWHIPPVINRCRLDSPGAA
jgi:hypothetical protein